MVLCTTCCCCCSVRTGTFVIGVLSLIESLVGTIYFSAISFVLWAMLYQSDRVRQVTNTQGNEQFWNSFNAVSKWHKDIYGVMITMAVLSAVTFVAACMLIHGARKYKSCLFTPWLVITALKALFFIAFGIALIIMAPTWARQLGEFISAASSGSGVVTPTEEYVKAQLIAQGAGLIVFTIIGLYFFFVIVSHWQQVKQGQAGDDQVKPVPHY